MWPKKSLQATRDCVSSSVPQCGTEDVISPERLSPGREASRHVMKNIRLLIGICLLSALTGCHKPQVGEIIGAAEATLKAAALTSIHANRPDLSLSDLKFSDIRIWAMPNGKEQIIVVYAIPASAKTSTEGNRTIVTTKVIGVEISPSGKAESISESTRSREASAQANSTTNVTAQVNRSPIYDESVDGLKQIAAALETAAKEHKRVLLMFGANWCGWCHKLHTLFETDQSISDVLKANYVVVLIDVNKGHNSAVDTRYGNPTQHGLPVIVILDADGKQLTTEDTGLLEEGDHHSPQKVLAFLKAWAPKP